MAPPSCPENAFSPPTPLTPKLVALGLDSKAAGTLSNVYISAALNLKQVCETEYSRACDAIMAASEYRGHSSKEIRSKLLTALVSRYMQALSKWAEEATERTKACLLHGGRKTIPKPKIKDTVVPPELRSPVGSTKVVASAIPLRSTESTPCGKRPQDLTPFSPTIPSYAFPQPYPPPVRPKSAPFVTHIPPRKNGCRYQPRVASESDLDECIAAFSLLSLGPPSPKNRKIRKPSKTGARSPSCDHTTSNPKVTSRLSPSRPRLVSPTVDTSVALSRKTLSKTPPPHPNINIPRSQNIDIPVSNRRNVYSIPYRRPTMHQSTSPVYPSSFSSNTRRTPSLVSDHGSEASSPSTPPDFPSMPILPSTLVHKGSFPESASLLETFFVPHSESGWQDIDFGTDLRG